MHRFRLLLLPLSWIYGAVLSVRNILYDKGILPSKSPSVKTIVIGNLAFGGTGKTPHAATILKMLDGRKAAFLSRGYGRSGNDTYEIEAESDSTLAGDEPLLIARKFPNLTVVVDNDRLRGIDHILKSQPQIEVVVLDDALQHRKLKGGLNILLTTWQEPFFTDYLLPAGNLRDVPMRAKSVQLLIVTKCPENASQSEKVHFRKKLGHLKVPVLFSTIAYGKIKSIFQSHSLETSSAENIQNDQKILLVTGIANASLFETEVASRFEIAKHISFGDHHQFSRSDFQGFRDFIDTFAPGRAALLTTEKDAMRMMCLPGRELIRDIPAFYWEIEARLGDDEAALQKMIDTYVEHA